VYYQQTILHMQNTGTAATLEGPVSTDEAPDN
jgi:hypothetical protein